jgi:hypothetical protein
MTDPTTIRDALEAAVPQENDAPAPEPVAAPEPVEAPTESVAKEPKAEPVRSADGKFAKEEPSINEALKAQDTPAITPGPKSEPKSEPVKEKAPVSWRPEVREHWSTLPADVRAEVMRREQEVQRTLQETSEARKLAESIQRTVQPYEMLIKAEGGNTLAAIDSLMATAARLRTAPAPDLANLVAGIVKQFGVGRFGNTFIEQLDSALAGQVPQVDPNQAQVQQLLQQQLAPMQQFMSQFQQAQAAQAAQVQQQAVSEVGQFLEKAEFGEDVREEMADIMELAQKRGREISLGDAYRQACMINTKVRTVLEARAKAKGAQSLQGAAQKAKAAAVSVSGAPALAVPQQGATDVRSAIEAALAVHTR